jgi:hypothetical protein
MAKTFWVDRCKGNVIVNSFLWGVGFGNWRRFA